MIAFHLHSTRGNQDTCFVSRVAASSYFIILFVWTASESVMLNLYQVANVLNDYDEDKLDPNALDSFVYNFASQSRLGGRIYQNLNEDKMELIQIQKCKHQ